MSKIKVSQMPYEPALQGSDMFPFVRTPQTGNKLNKRGTLDDLKAFLGGGAVSCFYTPQLNNGDDVLGFGGTLENTIYSQPVQFDSEYLATFTNTSNNDIYVEYFQNLVIFTGTNRPALEQAAAAIGQVEPVLELEYTLFSKLFVQNLGEVVNNQFFFRDNFQKNVGGGYLLQQKKTHVMNSVFRLPANSYALISYSIAATRAAFYGSTAELLFSELAFLRVNEGRQDGYEPLNTKFFI